MVLSSKTKFYIGAGIIILALVFALGWCSKPCPEVTTTSSSTVVIDTVLQPQFVYRDTGSVKYKFRIIDKSRIDTVANDILAGLDTTKFPVNIDSSGLYLTPAFEVEYSNISPVTKDSHEVKYKFPEGKLIFTERPSPKEIITNNIKETITITIEKPYPWYKQDWFQYTSAVVCAAAGGYIGFNLGSK
jgi:hypothetical protein